MNLMNDVKTTHLWFCSRDEVLGLLFHNTIGSQARKSNSSYLLSSNSNKLLSYLNMWICWVKNEQSPRLLLKRIYTSYWQILHMACSWRPVWSAWKWSSHLHKLNGKLLLLNMVTTWLQNLPHFRKLDWYQIEYTCEKGG